MKMLVKNIMRKALFNYKIFYFLQAVLKYIPFRIFSKIRTAIYRPFFNKIGKGVIIWDNVLFKFPEGISLGDNVQIAQQCVFVGKGGLEIGNDVMIGGGQKLLRVPIFMIHY